MTNNISTTCTDNAEIIILFWSLIVAIFSILIAVFICWVERRQSAKLNSINLLKENLEQPFKSKLIDNFCEEIKACHYIFVEHDNKTEESMFSFDKVPLIKICNRITFFLGEIAYLQYAIPYRYSRLNSSGQKVVSYVEEKMLLCALYENSPQITSYDKEKMINKRKAKKIYRKFLRRIKKFYKKTFKLYKYGL